MLAIIPYKLLFSIKDKFRRLSTLIEQSISYIENKGVPLCDFQINSEAIRLYKQRIRDAKRLNQTIRDAATRRQEWAQLFEKSKSKVRILVKISKDEDEKKSEENSLDFANELVGSIVGSSSGSDLKVDSSKSEVTLQALNSIPSVGESSISSSDTSFSEVFADPTPCNRRMFL